MLGRAVVMPLSGTPSQRAKVAAYWSTEIPGPRLPCPTSNVVP